MKNKISRRQFLQVAGASAAALLLASCSGNSVSSVSSSSVASSAASSVAASSEAASSAAASSEATSTVTTTGKTLVVYPQPGAVIMQYTGLGEVYGNEPPTYACVGDRDYIADERVMRWRIETIRSQGTPAEIEVFPGLAHGFGLGTGTSAEGWLDHAVAFWEENT